MSVSLISKSTANVHGKDFKVVLPSLSFNTVSVPTVNVVDMTTTPTHQYANLISNHAVVHRSVFSFAHVNISPAPASLH